MVLQLTGSLIPKGLGDLEFHFQVSASMKWWRVHQFYYQSPAVLKNMHFSEVSDLIMVSSIHLIKCRSIDSPFLNTKYGILLLVVYRSAFQDLNMLPAFGYL